ncbi:MAG: hypothetical protein AVDCRST_MAG66-1514 [uncultured Pseudonocardia sp.]|uniref:Uncharacterized protein n=1 Tax=uncultured Pseudonocardia sp. TaxID=211455 RepID=A0A6J4P2M0_9PSEU|nr:MAG: hypothetical protein AVDCRST_MAG66-1514 [uncultured Pseudonocardia sp.]
MAPAEALGAGRGAHPGRAGTRGDRLRERSATVRSAGAGAGARGGRPAARRGRAFRAGAAGHGSVAGHAPGGRRGGRTGAAFRAGPSGFRSPSPDSRGIPTASAVHERERCMRTTPPTMFHVERERARPPLPGADAARAGRRCVYTRTTTRRPRTGDAAPRRCSTWNTLRSSGPGTAG